MAIEQSRRIREAERVYSYIEVGVDPTCEPDWIRLGVTASLRIVVPEVVVVGVRLLVLVRTRRALVVDEGVFARRDLRLQSRNEGGTPLEVNFFLDVHFEPRAQRRQARFLFAPAPRRDRTQRGNGLRVWYQPGRARRSWRVLANRFG